MTQEHHHEWDWWSYKTSERNCLPRLLLCLLLHVDAAIRHHLRWRDWHPLDTKSAGGLNLNLPASRIVRNNFLSFITYPVWNILL
jgi:hypothetical protein